LRCPNCGHENIPGVDLCDQCGSDLAGLDLPEAERSFRGRLLSDQLGDLPLVPPLSVPPDATAADAIRKMRTARHGCVLVQDGPRLVGIFTERDVLAKIVRPRIDPDAVTMAEVMTPDPTTLSITDPPAFAIYLTVSRGLRHLPVMDGEDLRGFISVRHLLRHIHEDVLGGE
jgi:CBS domain-containing protein